MRVGTINAVIAESEGRTFCIKVEQRWERSAFRQGQCGVAELVKEGVGAGLSG